MGTDYFLFLNFWPVNEGQDPTNWYKNVELSGLYHKMFEFLMNSLE